MLFILLDEEIRYPEENSKLFKEDGTFEELANIRDLMQEFGSYADGYQTGAIKLIDLALNTPTVGERDIMIYPIVFLMRHYCELRLKELCQALNYCHSQDNGFPTGHNLQYLWNLFKGKYRQIGEDTSTSEFQNIENIMLELHAFDPMSMSFRYPVDREGNSTQTLTTINLVNLRDTFIRVSFMFDGLSMQLAHYIDITNEIISNRYEDYFGD